MNRIMSGPLRYVVTSGLSVVVAFVLFLLMRSMIALGGDGLEEGAGGRVIDFVRVQRDSDLMMKKRQLPEKEEIDKQPPPPALNLPDVDKPGATKIQIAPPSIVSQIDLGGPTLGGGASDTDIIPLVRVEPLYPRGALDQGVEGYVTVQFTISTTGKVKDPKVIDAKPPNIFNQAVIRAVKKWKYNPKVVNGVAQETPGVTVTLEFEIADKK